MQNRAHPIVEDVAQLVFETPNLYRINMGTTWDGFFKPPATGDYRFYMSCDDPCELYMDKTNPLSSGVDFVTEKIANRNWWTTWRNYYDPPAADHQNQFISDWISLTEGEHYKIFAQHTQGSGPAHITVSVEHKQDGVRFDDHPMAMREQQFWEINQD